MTSENLDALGSRLKEFLEYLRPRLLDGSVDTARLSKMRSMADMRIKAAAVRKPALSVREMCDQCCSRTNPARFDLLSAETGMLSSDELSCPVPVIQDITGLIIQCALTFEVLPPEKSKILVREFLSGRGASASPLAPPAQTPAPTKSRVIPQRIRLLLEKVTDLWSVPENTLKVQKMLSDPNSITENIAVEVERDPGLSAHLLKVVNSAFYGLPGRVLSIRQAIVILGYQETKRLVTVSSLISKLNKANPEIQIDFKTFWSHSLWTAHAASFVSQLTGQGKPDDLFTAGLLHDMGKLIVYQYLTFAVKQILSAVGQGVPYHQAEERVLGTDHTMIGGTICERWKFPPEVVEAVRNHLEPLSVLESMTLPRESMVVASVCALAKVTPPPEELSRWYAVMKIRPEQFDHVREQATEQTLRSLKAVMVG